MKRYLGLRGHPLNLSIGFIAGLDFLLFGYDQGVTGGLLELSSFKKHFPSIDPYRFRCENAPAGQEFSICDAGDRTQYQSHSNAQAIAVSSYNLGCLAGAIACIWLGNKLGRRRTIFLGSAIMIVGAILQASAFSVTQLIIGRIITGIGNGLNTSTVPVWQSETSKVKHRGPMVMFEGMLIPAGVTISYWLDFGFRFLGQNQVSWRFPLAFQAVFATVICLTVLGLPESPRWLVMNGRTEKATQVLSALRDAEPEDADIQQELAEINNAVNESKKGSFRDIFTMRKDSRHFHRTMIACASQAFQQICGINLITYYAPIIYNQMGLKGYLPSLITACNGTEYWLVSIAAIWLVEKMGRRKLMLVGSIGQCLSMVALAVSAVLFERGHTSAGPAIATFLFLFNSFFGVGWLGMSWLYPAEVTPTSIRAPANALSTGTNWLFNFLVVMISPVAFAAIRGHTYAIFAGINLLIIPVVYLFFPETKGHQLEEMDRIFAVSGCMSVVAQSMKEKEDGGRSEKADVEAKPRSSSSTAVNGGFEDVRLSDIAGIVRETY